MLDVLLVAPKDDQVDREAAQGADPLQETIAVYHETLERLQGIQEIIIILWHDRNNCISYRKTYLEYLFLKYGRSFFNRRACIVVETIRSLLEALFQARCLELK